MSDHLTYGHASTFRRRGVLERLAASLSRLAADRLGDSLLTRAFNAAVWATTAGRGLRATLPHGEVVRLRPSCRSMSWNLEEYEAFRAVTRPGDIIVEAGANVGAYTVLFAQWTGESGHVFAFEPVPSIAHELREQLALNSVAARVTVVESAVAEGAGALPLTAPGRVGINRRAVAGDPDAQRIVANTVGLDEFCAGRGVTPHVVKIDVEGAELAVLRGARRTLAAAPSGHLFVEWHPSLWPAYGLSADDVRQELDRQRLRAEPLRPGDDVWRVEGICARLVRAG